MAALVGRDAAGEELSTFGGNGALLHGAASLPRALALGADLRGAFVANDVQDPNGAKVAVFPMQADLRARVALGAGISVAATGGLRGQVRDPDLVVPPTSFQPASTSRLISREHYLMWQPEAVGPYLRAGRFYAPFGLRMPEHILYVERDLGFDELMESYNVSGGWVYDRWELHLTLVGPDFARHIGSQADGVAVYGERRLLDDRLAVAGQARVAGEPGVARAMVGTVVKAYLEPARAMLIGEVDAVQLLLEGPDAPARAQVVGALGVVIFPARGLVVTLLGERNQIDVRVDDAWTAGTALVNWFPYAHVELQVMGRLQLPSGGEVTKTLFAQLHYYL